MEIQEAVIQSSVRDHPPILEDILLTKRNEEQVKDIRKDVLVEQTQDDKEVGGNTSVIDDIVRAGAGMVQ